MKISTFPENWVAEKQRRHWLEEYSRKHFLRILSSIKHGCVILEEEGSKTEYGDSNSKLTAHIIVLNPAFYRMILFHGSIGAGEAYMSECWRSPNLTDVVRVICRNMQQLEEMEKGLTTVSLLAKRLKALLIPNSLSGSRHNIHAHYDLSNEFFKLFLDGKMMYSSAIFADKDTSLEQSQINKLESIARKLDIEKTDKVIEIGTGWGGLAIFLAEHYGCHVTTTTISKEQYQYATEQVRQKKLTHLVTVLDQDYRELSGSFDKLVSIEMIEAVGLRYLDVFFNKCNALLKPGGKMVLQAITIPEQRFEYASKSVDFIQQYIFPGGFLPSVESMMTSVGKNTNLQIEQLQDIGLDYAETLLHWRRRFNESKDKITHLGFDGVFIRLWEYYLCYCEGGFRERAISTVQMTFRRI